MAIIIKDALKNSEEILKSAGIDAALADAEILLAHLVKWPRWRLWANCFNEISDESYAEFLKIIDIRAQRIPLPYITGCKEFYGREFLINKNVLIPRPETELLVEEAIKYILDNNLTTAADIGTGSGAIAISLALETDAHVYTVDISSLALSTAIRNIEAFEITNKITTYEGNLLKPLIDGNISSPDIIIANLPYIPLTDKNTLEPEVKDFEPGIALFSGTDGLDAIRELILQASGYCKKGTIIGLEFGIGQKNAIAECLTNNSWKIDKIIFDYSGIIRYIFAKFAV